MRSNFSYEDVVGRILASSKWDTEKELAEKLGISPNTWTAYKKGKGSFGVHQITKICDALNVSEQWLLFGDQKSASQSQQQSGFRRIDSDNLSSTLERETSPFRDAIISDLTQGNLISIPQFGDVRPAAGAGSSPAGELQTGIVAFDSKWLRDLGVNAAAAVILVAQGDSMYPTIPNGSPMLIDTSNKQVRNGCIYVFDVDGDLMVKRIERLPDGTIDLISDNRTLYPVRNLSIDRLMQMTMIGRVYSAIRNF